MQGALCLVSRVAMGLVVVISIIYGTKAWVIERSIQFALSPGYSPTIMENMVAATDYPVISVEIN